MSKLLIVAAMLLPLAARCDESFRDDFNAADGWIARPDWLVGAAAAQPKVTVENGIAHFEVDEPGKGMKWRREVDIPDLDMTPWLVIRYRVESYAAARVDYLLWVGDTKPGHDGVPLIVGDRIKADGEWHTQAFNLAENGVAPPITAFGLQCFATDTANASLWVDSLYLTDTPPPDAEGYEAPVEGKSEAVKLPSAGAWATQPSWLGNYTADHACKDTPGGTEFTVAEAGMGCKWSYDLPATVKGFAWLALRYRATGSQGYTDYALYLGSEPGGKAHEEQTGVSMSDLVCDGAWHVQIAPVTISSVKTLAVQVQAAEANAKFEIGGITFHERKPPVRLADEFEAQAGWADGGKGFRAVSLPAGNVTGAQLARRLGYQGWIPEGQVTATGIPFTVRTGSDAAIATTVRGLESIAVPLSGRAAEAYLLLAAQLPARDEASFGGGAMQGIRQVERLVARIEYADGTAEEQFPFALTRKQHVVARGLGVYALALEPGKALKQITLQDGMANGAFALVALTLGGKPGPASEATAQRAAAVATPAAREVKPQPAGVFVEGRRVRVVTGGTDMDLDCTRGLRVTAVRRRLSQSTALPVKPGPLFRLETGELKLTSEDFTVTGISDAKDAISGKTVSLTSDRGGAPIRVSVTVDAQEGEIGLRATVDLGGRDPVQARFIFPELTGISFGANPADTWYWMPRRGDVISDVATSLREPYGGSAPMQIIGAFGPAAGTGLYMMTQDMEATPRFYQVQKQGKEVRLGVEYFPCGGTAPRGAGVWQTPRTVIGTNRGDWHEQFDRYKAWVGTWYKPYAPRKPWFREVFSFRQQFMSFPVPTDSGMFDPKTKALHLQEVVKQDAAAFGGVDYLHLFDWGYDPVHGRCGDYVPWDYLGGADHFKQAVQEVKDAGTPVGLYIEGYLVDPESNLGKAHGKDWQLLGPDGKPYTYFAPSYNMCPAVKDWQDYLSATYARAKRETGAVGFYIDEYGFANPMHDCYNPNHGHPMPTTPVLGEREMLRRVHEALGPDAALYTEESPPDANSQFQDGSFTYHISSVTDDLSPTHVNLYRFAFPTFKTIEIITCDNPLGSNVEACKRVLFNGEAIWLEGTAEKWFAPQTRVYIAKMHDVLRRNRQCFTSPSPQPLVPTLMQGVYANAFPERADGRGRTCWTVYNTGFRTVRGELLRVPCPAGARFRDEFTGKEIPARVEGGSAYLRLEIGPRDVAVISRASE